MRRISGEPAPWSSDPVLRENRFTNVYRASDRVSKYLIKHVIYDGDPKEEEVFFRTLLFKLFNRTGTWELLVDRLGPPTWRAFDLARYEAVLDDAFAHSVDVAHQYCGQLGKNANCQALVSLTLAREEMPVPVALKLYLPKPWADDDARRRKCGVPESLAFRPKWKIALDEIARVVEADVTFADVLADGGYGVCAEFRRGLTDRGLRWIVGVSPDTRVYAMSARVQAVASEASTGRPRTRRTATAKPRRARDCSSRSGRTPSGRSPGAAAPKACSVPSSRLCVFASPMANRWSTTATAPATSPGSSSSAVPAARPSTTCRTTRRTLRSKFWLPRSKGGGPANKRTSR